MKLSDYALDVPTRLIAQYPLKSRSASRLMVVNAPDQPAIAHRQFKELTQLLQPGDLLVLNDTRVIPARLRGRKASGGKIEILVERLLMGNQLLAKVRASKSPKPDSRLILDSGIELTVLSRQEEFFVLSFTDCVDPLSVLNDVGEIPLPPYITRDADSDDVERYQTVYGQIPGAVAAPTAGLHFDGKMFSELESAGIKTTCVTLHVGAGTFQPVRVEDPADHVMHAEFIDVNQAAVNTINDTRAKGGRIIAVGTTSVRCLETAARESLNVPLEVNRKKINRKELNRTFDRLECFTGESRLFMRPGEPFHLVDGMITNFHLPQSTLLMLVAAFAGYTKTIAAYREAIDNEYRFYSYGDAMLLWPSTGSG